MRGCDRINQSVANQFRYGTHRVQIYGSLSYFVTTGAYGEKRINYGNNDRPQLRCDPMSPDGPLSLLFDGTNLAICTKPNCSPKRVHPI